MYLFMYSAAPLLFRKPPEGLVKVEKKILLERTQSWLDTMLMLFYYTAIILGVNNQTSIINQSKT